MDVGHTAQQNLSRARITVSIRRFLTSLFGGTSPLANVPTPSPARRRQGAARDSRLSHSVLSVNSLGFVGQAQLSPNKRWAIACTDRQSGMNPRPGEADGSAILVDYPEDRVVVRITGLFRPMDSAVSDVGVFLVNDANFGGQLSADVQSFDASGKNIFGRKYKANVFNLAISRCGRYGVAQTCNASNDDGNLLEVFNLQVGAIVFSRAPESGWADQYEFTISEDGKLIRLAVIHKDIGRFNYSASGDFLDSEMHQKARLQKGSAEMRIHSAKCALKADPQNRELARELVEVVLDGALADLGKERVDFLATGLRVKGEALELLGRTADAISAYEAAIAANPKIGVAKRLAALKKKPS